MFYKLFFSLRDLLAILKHRNYNSMLQFKPSVDQSKILRILGNGKSLNNSVLTLNDDVDYMVVNRHVLSDSYSKIKPLYYVLADPFFFFNKDGLKVIKTINDSTKWKMNLCIPRIGGKSRRRIEKLIINKQIHLIWYNCTEYRGYSFVRYYMYRHQLAMPRVQNVLVASIMIGILKKYKNIELYGVEHSWTKNLYVGDDNLVYLYDPHFYDKNVVKPIPLQDSQYKDGYPLHRILMEYANMFKSYWLIKNYVISQRLPVNIINRTKGSFIDAFKRE